MKLKMFFASLAMFAALFACKKEYPAPKDPSGDTGGDDTEIVDPNPPAGDENEEPSGPQTIEFMASISSGWEMGEKVAVWDGTNLEEFTVSGCTGNTAVLTGVVAPGYTDLYALYPYSSNAQFFAFSGKVTTNVQIPQVRYPGDDGAVGFAKLSGQAFALTNPMAYLKVVLADDMTDVTSLVLSGNEADDILSGTLGLSVSESGTFSAAFTSESDGMTLEFKNSDGSPLTPGVEYLIPFVPQNFTSGVSLGAKYTGSSKAVTKACPDPLSVSEGQTVTLSAAPLTKEWFAPAAPPAPVVTGYYAKYMDGQDITIAGKTYNKSKYGDGTLVGATETKELKDGNKVYFVEPGATVKIGPTNSCVKYIVIGNDPDQRTKVTQDVSIKVGKDQAHYAFLNLEIDMKITATGSGNDVMTVVNNGSTIERIAYDNCRMTYPTNGRQFMYKGDATTFISDFAFHNCDYCFTYATDHIYLLRLDSAAATHDTFDFQNNVFWHTGTLPDNKGFNIVAGQNAKAGTIIFKNNTLVNLKTQSNASSVFHVGLDADKADINDNIFYFSKASCNMFLHRKSVTEGSVTGNVYYIESGENTFKAFQTNPSWVVHPEKLAASPFSSMDLSAGKFVKTSDYASLGAQR